MACCVAGNGVAVRNFLGEAVGLVKLGVDLSLFFWGRVVLGINTV